MGSAMSSVTGPVVVIIIISVKVIGIIPVIWWTKRLVGVVIIGVKPIVVIDEVVVSESSGPEGVVPPSVPRIPSVPWIVIREGAHINANGGSEWVKIERIVIK
jgi:hypothetical protein